jgi:hypothetical protein
MTEYKLVVVGGTAIDMFDFVMIRQQQFNFLVYFMTTAGGVGKSALTIQLIQNQ